MAEAKMRARHERKSKLSEHCNKSLGVEDAKLAKIVLNVDSDITYPAFVWRGEVDSSGAGFYPLPERKYMSWFQILQIGKSRKKGRKTEKNDLDKKRKEEKEEKIPINSSFGRELNWSNK